MPRCFCNYACLIELLLKFSGGCYVFCILQKKITSCKCLLGSRLKVTSHCFAQAFILLRSLLKLVADKFVLSTAEKCETSSAKSLAFVVRTSERSFI